MGNACDDGAGRYENELPVLALQAPEFFGQPSDSV
jgi:hypothetical protein